MQENLLTARRPGSAIVMGGSIAGLWTARVLADHFEQVFILERDHLPDGPQPRPGAPQSRQYHILLQRGLQIMHQLFPGMKEELIAAGAIPFDPLLDVRLRLRNRWLPQISSNQSLLSCSRVLLESAMRQRLRQNPRLRIIEDVEVASLETDTQCTRINGVHVRWRRDGEQPRGAQSTIRADLIVDALGRRSPTPEWLAQSGYPAPQEEVVDSFLGYVTRRFRKPDNIQAEWPILLLLATAPNDRRGGLIFPEENGLWVVMMAGFNKDYPPTDDMGFMEFARSLGSEFYQVVQSAEAVSEPSGYRGTETRWRHYEKLSRWPERYVVLGDAFCGFNPIYGQGMTIAALSAVALGEQLGQANSNLDGVAKRTLNEITRVTQNAWLLATGSDLEWPGTLGEVGQSLNDRFGRWYIDRLLDAMPYDPIIRLAFNDVNQLVKPAATLFAPTIMLRVFRHRGRLTESK